MADPVVVDVPPEEWVKVATAVTCGIVNKQAYDFNYYQTYRLTGAGAPNAIIATAIPDEAVPMFPQSDQELIASSEGIDVYVCCFRRDNQTELQGKVRVDI